MKKLFKEKKTKEEIAEAKRLKKEQRAQKKAEKKQKNPKQPKAPKSKDQKKANKTPKVKKPKVTKEEKIQKQRERLLQKTKNRVAKIRAKGAKRAEKIRINQERVTEKKKIKREFKAEKKQFEKSLRDEIKLAKKDVPKSNLPKILIPVALVLLLISSAVFMTSRGIGPLASFKMPEPPGFVKVIGETISNINPLEKLSSLNPFNKPGAGGGSGAEKAVKNMFDSLKALDFTKASAYTDMSLIVIPDGYIELIGTETLMNGTFERLEYEIVSPPEEISETEFDIVVNITAVDYKKLMAEFIREYLRITLDYSNSQMQLGIAGVNTLFTQFVKNPNIGTVDNEITLKVVWNDNAWMVQPNNSLINALFGGAITVAGDFFAP